MPDQQAPQTPGTSSPQKSLNEEGGSLLLTGAHGAAGLGLLAVAFNAAASGHLITGAVLGVAGLAVGANAAFSSFFTQTENYATVTTKFGQKMGNITGGGIKFKKPWPWRSVYEKVPVYTQREKCDLTNLQTHDNVTVKELNANILYRVADPATFAFSASTRVEQMKEIVANSIKAQIGKSIAIKTELHEGEGDTARFYDLKSDRARIAEQIKADVNARLQAEYGLEVVDVPMEAVLDERFTEAVAKRILAEQEGLAEQAKLAARGKGVAGERDAILDGMAHKAKALYEEGLFPSLDAAVDFVRFIIEKDAQQNTKGIVILNAAGPESKQQTEFLAASVGANRVAGMTTAATAAPAAKAPAQPAAHPADEIMNGPKAP